MVQALAGEDVEVVEPEINHHLVEATRIFDRHGQPRRSRLLDDNPGALARGLELLGVGLRFAGLARPVLDKQLHRRHPQRVERREL